MYLLLANFDLSQNKLDRYLSYHLKLGLILFPIYVPYLFHEYLLEIWRCFATFGHLFSVECFGIGILLCAHKMKIPKSWHEFVNNKLVVKCVEMCIPCSMQLHSAHILLHLQSDTLCSQVYNFPKKKHENIIPI